VFEIRIFGRIFAIKRGEDTGGWRKLHSEKLHNLYSMSLLLGVVNRVGDRGMCHAWKVREIYIFSSHGILK
jgi:hypothetical protein